MKVTDELLEELGTGERVAIPHEQLKAMAQELFLHRALSEPRVYNPMAALQQMIQETGSKVAALLLPALDAGKVTVMIARPLNLMPEELEEVLLHQLALKDGLEAASRALAREIKGENPYTPLKDRTPERGN